MAEAGLNHGYAVLCHGGADDKARRWLALALDAFARNFAGKWASRAIPDATIDAALCCGPDDPLLAQARALGVPAVVRMPLGAGTIDGTLGIWGGNAVEAGHALALLASEPRLRRQLAGETGAAADGLWHVEGPFDSSYSLAIVNRELARALAAQGVDVALGDSDPASRRLREPDWNFIARHAGVRQLAERSGAAAAEKPAEVLLFNTYPPQVEDLHGRFVALANYAWEESGFPADYVRDFNWRLNLITVVSPLVKKILRDNGVVVPIAVVGNGVDHLLGVVPQEPAAERALPAGLGWSRDTDRFRFLHVSSCFPRKGLDVLLDAYGRAFRREDAVTLVIKSFPNPHNEARAQIAAHLAADPHYPDVVLIDEDLPEENIAWLYAQCNAFVLPTRAEGFGLPIAEATLYGLPTIVSGYGGHRLISEDGYAFAVDYHFSYARSHLDVFDSAWIDPDAADLARLMRQVRAMPPAEREALAERSRTHLLSRLGWQQVAARTRAAIAATANLPALPRQARIAWISTWNSRCGIAAYSHYLLEGFPRERIRILAELDAEPLGADGPEVFRCWAHGQVGADRILSTVRLHRCTAAVLQWHPSFLALPTLRALLHGLRSAGVRSYMTLHNTADLVAHQDGGEIRETLGAATRLLVHGVADLNNLKSVGLVDNVTLFPHGVLAAARPGAAAAGKRSSGRVIGSFGYIRPHKGLRQLIAAFALLAPRLPDLRLLLVNALFPAADSAEELAACEELIAQIGLGERIQFETRFLPEAEALELLAHTELVVFPYQYSQESSSAAVRMGIGSGRPVLATPLPIFADVPDAVEELPGITPEEIAAGIERLLHALADPTRRQAIESRAARWRDAHHWKHLSTRLLNLIDGEENDPFGCELLDIPA